MEEKILVVDDEKDICDILQFNLEHEGYKVDLANSAEDALAILTDKHSLIILDVMMGGMSGFLHRRRRLCGETVFGERASGQGKICAQENQFQQKTCPNAVAARRFGGGYPQQPGYDKRR